jgi:hypothetical protein
LRQLSRKLLMIVGVNRFGQLPSCPFGNLQKERVSDQTDVLQGTLDLLIMRTIALERRCLFQHLPDAPASVDTAEQESQPARRPSGWGW